MKILGRVSHGLHHATRCSEAKLKATTWKKYTAIYSENLACGCPNENTHENTNTTNTNNKLRSSVDAIAITKSDTITHCNV